MRGGADSAESRIQPKAEFHDIGKLIDWVAVGLHPPMTRGEPHEFERCVEDPEHWGVRLEGNAAWANIVRKDSFANLRSRTWPDSLDWLFASHADSLGAGFGRTIDEGQINAPPRQGIHCLWTGKDWDDEARHPSEAPPDPRLEDEESLREMIAFLNDDPAWEEAEEKYGDLLRRRAETARPGLNVTTLLSHCRTVGRLARVLARVDWTTSPGGTWKGGGQTEGANKPLISAHYTVDFPHQPYRARDMHVFHALERFLAELEGGEFADNVLARFDNQLVVVFESQERRDRFEQQALSQSFLLRGRVRRKRCTIAEYRQESLGSFKEEEERWISPPDLPDRIEEPICEVCKMKHATRNWLTDAPAAAREEEDIVAGREDLCEECFNLRKGAPGLRKLGKEWRDGALVWVHFRLDFERLRAALKKLAQDYLREVEWKKGKDEKKDEVVESLDVSLPVIVDFVEDYKEFLHEVRGRLEAKVGEASVERLMDNLLAVRLGAIGPLQVMEICLDLLRERFPKLCKPDFAFPLRVAFSASNVKHPFFQHWRFLQATEREIEFQLVNSGIGGLRVADASDVINPVRNAARSSLHGLAMMSAKYPSLGALALLDKTGRGLKLEGIAELLKNKKLDLETARILANLASKSWETQQDDG